MAKFEDLIKDSRIANHPLLGNYKNLAKQRARLNKYSQAHHSDGLQDIFSSESVPSEVNSLDLKATVYEASRALNDALSQFDLPMFPKVSYQQAKEIKYARNDESRVVSGQVLFRVEFKTATNVKRIATIPVPVTPDGVVSPSTMEISGKVYVLAQKALDEILRSATSVYLPEMRDQFDPPFTYEEKGPAVAVRNNIGWQPRANDPSNYLGNACREASKTAQEVMREFEQWSADQGYPVISEAKYVNGDLEWATEDDEVTLIAQQGSDGVNLILVGLQGEIASTKLPRKQAQGMDEATAKWYKQYQAQGLSEDEALDKALDTVQRLEARTAQYYEEDVVDYQTEEALANILSDPAILARAQELYATGADSTEMLGQMLQAEPGIEVYDPTMEADWSAIAQVLVEQDFTSNFPTASKKAVKATPSAYELVVKDLEDAEKDGEDTFPRIYEHLLRHYILNHVSTASKDKWMIPLINDGWCLNPYGTNVRSRKAFKTWEEAEKRIAQMDEFDKEIELEVEQPGQEKGPRFYRDTKTPIEVSDKIRFKGQDGPMRGNIVEIDEEGNFIIVKSKGMEYRVEVDSIEPVRSTFEKMYK